MVVLPSTVLCLMYLSWCKAKRVAIVPSTLPPLPALLFVAKAAGSYAISILFANTVVYMKFVLRVCFVVCKTKNSFLLSYSPDLAYSLVCIHVHPTRWSFMFMSKFLLNERKFIRWLRLWHFSFERVQFCFHFAFLRSIDSFHFVSFACDSLILHR